MSSAASSRNNSFAEPGLKTSPSQASAKMSDDGSEADDAREEAARNGRDGVSGAKPGQDSSVPVPDPWLDATTSMRTKFFPWISPDGGVYTQSWTKEVDLPAPELGSKAWLVDNETLPGSSTSSSSSSSESIPASGSQGVADNFTKDDDA